RRSSDLINLSSIPPAPKTVMGGGYRCLRLFPALWATTDKLCAWAHKAKPGSAHLRPAIAGRNVWTPAPDPGFPDLLLRHLRLRARLPSRPVPTGPDSACIRA